MISEDISSTVSKLSARIGQIQLKIDHVNAITNEAVEKLEAQKRDLRKWSPKYEIIQKNIHDITIDHDHIVNKLLQRQTDAQARKKSYDQLDFSLAQLDREISRIQADRDRVLHELNQKRDQILHALQSSESLTIQIKKLSDEIALLSADHEREMGSLNEERMLIEARTDLTDSEKQLALAKLEKTIQDREEVYQMNLKSLERQRRESLLAIKDLLDTDVEDMKNVLLNEIDELEAMKVGASPSELEVIMEKIEQLKLKMGGIEAINDLQNRGLTLTPNGRIRTQSGTILTISEAIEAGLLDGINIDNITKLIMDERLKEHGLNVSKSGTLRTQSGRFISLPEARQLGLIDASMAELLHVAKRTTLTPEAAEKLKEHGIDISKSGTLKTASGKIMTIEQAKDLGIIDDATAELLEGIKRSYLAASAAKKLREQGLDVTKSGTVRTKSGRFLTVEEARKLGLIDAATADALEASKKSSLSASSASLSQQMSTEDVNYLKVTVGRPLTLALAEICMKQPRDPIHYLGHWLFKYRYNQEIDEVKKREIEQLISERERIRLENWHREVEDAARSAVLEMVFKAHDEAMQNELKVAEKGLMLGEEGGREEGGEEENDELAEEAKDVLGEYTGPPAGQRRI
ncbi:hypothetical protein Trydic_g9348 [Trypoxylus dichotomus]